MTVGQRTRDRQRARDGQLTRDGQRARDGQLTRDGQRGQASVELLAAVPLVLLVVLAAAQVFAALACRGYAAHGAQAGAVALIQDADPVRAARSALPGWSTSSVSVASNGRKVVVRVRPPVVLPGVEGLVTAEAAADAGPAS